MALRHIKTPLPAKAGIVDALCDEIRELDRQLAYDLGCPETKKDTILRVFFD